MRLTFGNEPKVVNVCKHLTIEAERYKRVEKTALRTKSTKNPGMGCKGGSLITVPFRSVYSVMDID